MTDDLKVIDVTKGFVNFGGTILNALQILYNDNTAITLQGEAEVVYSAIEQIDHGKSINEVLLPLISKKTINEIKGITLNYYAVNL